MNTQTKTNHGTDTEASETSDPAGVSELATQVVINSSVNASLELERNYMGYEDTDVLRLRGGGNSSGDDGTNSKSSGGMVTTASTSSGKRGPSSPLSTSKTKRKTVEVGKYSKEVNSLIGWLEQFTHTEKSKKLTVAGFEGIMGKTKALRDVYTDLCMKVTRLSTRSQLTQEQLKAMMTTYGDSLLEKTAEVQKLQRENEELRAEIQAREAADESAERRVVTTPLLPTMARMKPVTYAKTTKRDPKPGQSRANAVKNLKKSNKKTLEKCREVKAASRLTIEVPSGVTIASAKAELWATVKGKISNPRAKTLIKGSQIVIIPDDGNTFEVVSNLPNVKISGPRQPRVII